MQAQKQNRLKGYKLWFKKYKLKFADFLSKYKEESLYCVSCPTDSMEPTVPQKALIMLRKISQKQIKEGIYCIVVNTPECDKEVLIGRLTKHFGKWKLTFDNANYSLLELDKKEIKNAVFYKVIACVENFDFSSAKFF